MDNTSRRLHPKTCSWTEVWNRPFESAYNVLQKYAWANCAGSRQIARDLFGRAHDTATSTARELLQGTWMRQTKPTLPAGMVLGGVAGALNLSWMKLLAGNEALRFCPECLVEGYHTLIFQIKALKCCPMHGIPLTSNCSHCGKGTPPLSLWAPSFERPFCCRHCSQPLARTLSPPRWSATSEQCQVIESALQPIVKWLALLREFAVNGQSVPLPQLSIAGAFEGEDEAVVAFSIARELLPIQMPESAFETSKRPLQIVKLSTSLDSAFNLDARSYWQATTRLYREVKREVFAQVALKHRDCLAEARNGVWTQYDFGRWMTHQYAGLCPVAAGYYRWLRGSLMRLHELRKNLGRQCFDRFPFHDEAIKLKMHADVCSCFASASVCEELYRRKIDGCENAALFTRFVVQCASGATENESHLEVRHQGGNAEEIHLVLGNTQDLTRVDHG
jgi:hypothetical protein